MRGRTEGRKEGKYFLVGVKSKSLENFKSQEFEIIKSEIEFSILNSHISQIKHREITDIRLLRG